MSAGGACAGGWVSGEFPDAHPFFCGQSVTNGMRANMYGCHGGAYAHSGYTPGASDTSCGCPDWESEPYGLTVSLDENDENQNVQNHFVTAKKNLCALANYHLTAVQSKSLVHHFGEKVPFFMTYS